MFTSGSRMGKGVGFPPLPHEGEDGGCAAFHVEEDGFDAGNEEVVGGVGENGDHKGEGGGGKGVPEAAGEVGGLDEGGGIAGGGQHFHEAENCAEKSDEGGDSGDGGKPAEAAFHAGNFLQTGILDGSVDVFEGVVVVEDGGQGKPGDGTGGLLANGGRFDGIAAVEDVVDALEEVVGGNLGAVEVEEAFEEYERGENAAPAEKPKDGAASEEISGHGQNSASGKAKGVSRRTGGLGKCFARFDGRGNQRPRALRTAKVRSEP